MIVKLRCPTCAGPVFAARGRDRERVDCIRCYEVLITREDAVTRAMSVVTLEQELDDTLAIEVPPFLGREHTSVGIGIPAREPAWSLPLLREVA